METDMRSITAWKQTTVGTTWALTPATGSFPACRQRPAEGKNMAECTALHGRCRAPASKPAFTLIELLVVIAIITIIAAILFPVFARAREAARKTACLSNQHQIAMAVLMYIGDN